MEIKNRENATLGPNLGSNEEGHCLLTATYRRNTVRMRCLEEVEKPRRKKREKKKSIP